MPIRLLNTRQLLLREFGSHDQLPQYAILSHTWGEEEVLFSDCQSPCKARQKAGFSKIEGACRKALSQGFEWIWIDTCCIDKSSSAELSEAINSMFQWYQNAAVCYVFLVDLLPGSSEGEFRSSRWFRRGWTLQELVAPARVQFYDRSWNFFGEKTSQPLQNLISDITSIGEEILLNRHRIFNLPIAKRMSWAANRETTRAEDMAYCLLGIFNVNMPLLYGEGGRAFLRLQEEVIKTSTDMSIFAWKAHYGPDQAYRGIFARSPSEFRHFLHVDFKPNFFNPKAEWSMSNIGLCVKAELTKWRYGSELLMDLGWIAASPNKSHRVAILLLERVGIFIRAHPGYLFLFDEVSRVTSTSPIIYICRDINSLESGAIESNSATTLYGKAFTDLVWQDGSSNDVEKNTGYTSLPTPPGTLGDNHLLEITWAGEQRPMFQNHLWANSTSSGFDLIPSAIYRLGTVESPNTEGSGTNNVEDILSFRSLSDSDSGFNSCVYESERKYLVDAALRQAPSWLLHLRQRDETGDRRSSPAVSSALAASPRKRRRFDDNDMHSHRGEDSDISLTGDKSSSLKAIREGIIDLFECPFCLRNKVGQKNCLKGCELKSIEDVQRHLCTKHQAPFYCPVCYQTFKQTSARDRHVTSRTCQPRSPVLEGISSDQMAGVAQGLDYRLSEADQWFAIWDIVFPTLPRPESAFVDRDVVTTVSIMKEYWKTQGQQLISSVLISQNLPVPSMTNARSEMSVLYNLVLSDLIDRCLSGAGKYVLNVFHSKRTNLLGMRQRRRRE